MRKIVLSAASSMRSIFTGRRSSQARSRSLPLRLPSAEPRPGLSRSKAKRKSPLALPEGSFALFSMDSMLALSSDPEKLPSTARPLVRRAIAASLRASFKAARRMSNAPGIQFKSIETAGPASKPAVASTSSACFGPQAIRRAATRTGALRARCGGKSAIFQTHDRNFSPTLPSETAPATWRSLA